MEPKRHLEPKRNKGTSQKVIDGWPLTRPTFLPSLVWIRSTVSELKTFSWKNTFLTPVTPRDLWPRSSHMTCWGWGGGCCDQVWSKSIKTCWSYKHLSMTEEEQFSRQSEHFGSDRKWPIKFDLWGQRSLGFVYYFFLSLFVLVK